MDPKKRPTRSSRAPARIQSLDHDILCIIFSFLDFFDLARCSVVCKTWSGIINKSKLLEALYYKKWQMGLVGSENRSSGCPEKSLNVYLEEMALRHHRLALQQGRVQVDHWRAHSVGVDQCRKKMGLLLTGIGDKVMRLWSLESYKCVGEYPIPDKVPLVDFDFDESKIVGLVGSRICIWRRNGIRSIFPSREGTFPKGLCMRMHAGPVTCLCLSDDQLILSGSSLGSITVSNLLSDQRVAELRLTHSTGITTMCFNPSSHLLFAGSTAGYVFCWDLRTRRCLWETRVSPNVVYSMQHLRNDASSLVVGGIDGVLRILNQNTGEVVSRFVLEGNLLSSSSSSSHQNVVGSGTIQRMTGRRLSQNASIDSIPRSSRPPITCLAVGMKKVITTHNNKYIRTWKFN
ncbi:F-box/WD-40 repeat-containing protein At3g52030 isoform X2 [Rosa chinensis]|uniref:F-box/WD-40 repeat-containing protein At3g52030 isoform X2 n=1 Tax=Rosa chinensis TaxID=74649 RepID=UPI001AD8E2C4|nr:F-box/WD-40 repeat-containing protein At3g52030 isoform X2 [Rosa chinensis]